MKIMVNDVGLHLIIGGYIGYFKFLNVMNSDRTQKKKTVDNVNTLTIRQQLPGNETH